MIGRLLAAFCEYVRRHQAHHQPDAQWQQNHIVQITENRNEVGDQVDGAQGIGHHDDGQHLGKHRRAGVPTAEPQHHDLSLEGLGPILDALQHLRLTFVSVIGGAGDHLSRARRARIVQACGVQTCADLLLARQAATRSCCCQARGVRPSARANTRQKCG